MDGHALFLRTLKRACLATCLFTLPAAAQPVVDNPGNHPCPAGYRQSGRTCIGLHRDTPPAIPRDPRRACPDGFHASGSACVAVQ